VSKRVEKFPVLTNQNKERRASSKSKARQGKARQGKARQGKENHASGGREEQEEHPYRVY